ncbi:nascent polypeptide-associated complex protein [Ignisphaera sp. 4213-co]|uniref:Nascent polypeptide-associated complex protein n=1 Tax=Ignisphaera cupida TaxID=3050454 RepID=A0ABD4Z4W6_9CREN|nr:nascent polypeptide-associated complex protein [Ignisphaera sp. 4213-co]MDK6028361.1 nascent polypeptide-associated complex protein [Ignisphaera sp. 4213-co]
MFVTNPRELQKQLKQLKRMGIKIDHLQNVQKAVIELQDKRIVIENPEVMVMEFGGQKMFYIAGNIREEELSTETVQTMKQVEVVNVNMSSEDIQFVAEYLGIGVEEAKKLLIEAKGDIAKAIEIGQSRTTRKS